MLFTLPLFVTLLFPCHTCYVVKILHHTTHTTQLSEAGFTVCVMSNPPTTALLYQQGVVMSPNLQQRRRQLSFLDTFPCCSDYGALQSGNISTVGR